MEAKIEQPQEIEIRAVITRVDGTVIDLGVIDAHYNNPVRQFLWERVRLPLANARIRRANRGVNS